MSPITLIFRDNFIQEKNKHIQYLYMRYYDYFSIITANEARHQE